MSEKTDVGRPKRRSARSKQVAAPSAVHYVGYVEEDETPEAIMKKFEELEKVMAARQGEPNAPGALEESESADLGQEEEPALEEGLTDAQLMEVFKQTSIFNVKSALANNENLVHAEAEDELQTDLISDSDLSDTDEWEYLRGFWSDDDGAKHSEHWKKLKKQRNRGLKDGQIRQRGGSYAKPRQHIVTHYNTATQALIRRKVKVIDKDALFYVKVPNPLPLSWGRTIKPYVPKALRGVTAAAASDTENEDSSNGQQASTSYTEVEDVLHTDFRSVRQPCQAVLINLGWCHDAQGHVLEDPGPRLAALPLLKLCPVGFVFIWAEKEHVSTVNKQLYKWGFQYVENLTWVYLDVNNTILTLPSAYAQKSHLTLFIFRREDKGKDIELRHQRNPDVTFDTVRVADDGQTHRCIPNEAFVAIETLLPTGKGKFLELWAARNIHRPGWAHVVQVAGK